MRRVLGRFLWNACDVGLGRSYASGASGDDTQDCIRFQVATIRGMYPAIDWTPHHRLMHLDGQPVGTLANMALLVELGVGVEVSEPSEPGVYALQGWKGGSGHAIFIIRRGDSSLWVCDFTTATTDGLRPLEWVDVLRKWPSRMLVQLVTP